MVDVETGRVLQELPVPQPYFAEGLTMWGSTLVQLTWQSHVAFIYDRFSFRQLDTAKYTGEGWGLTTDGKALIMSDGTAQLRYLDPQTFRELRRVTVKDHGRPVTYLNELEWVKGEIYANVWYSDRIARISPATGKVLGWIDLAGLVPQNERTDPQAVLNGIAYDAEHDRLFVTGKLWPRLFEIKLVGKTESRK
jgi:glutamine cyclotransferase